MYTINYHDYKDDPARLTAEHGDNWMYVGRANHTHGLPASPLANPFVNSDRKKGQVVDDPIVHYKKWLWQKILTRDSAVMGELLKMNTQTALVCWCAPNDCHADVIQKAYLYLVHDQFTIEPTALPTKALSIRQPWAWLITRPDVQSAVERGQLYLANELKDVENRTWKTSFRGHFYIHAAKTLDKPGYEYIQRRWPHVPLPHMNELECGGIVGLARLADCVEHSYSRWKATGQHGFVLTETRPLPFRPCVGQQNFFEVQL